MNGFKNLLTATFLTAAMLVTGAAQAMEIQKFDKMADHDQDEYVAELVIGAQKVLIDAGKPDLATQVHKLFNTHLGNDKISLGLTEFERNLAIVRAYDAKNAVAHPNDPRAEVEDAMAITLENNGIKLPASFFTVLKDFKPKFPVK